MAHGNTAIFSGTASKTPTAVVAVVWETDFSASPAAPKPAKFKIKKPDNPTKVAKKLADDFNDRHDFFSATANGPKVVFTAETPIYEVSDMRFTINSETTNIPANGPSVPLGNTGLSVRNANS